MSNLSVSVRSPCHKNFVVKSCYTTSRSQGHKTNKGCKCKASYSFPEKHRKYRSWIQMAHTVRINENHLAKNHAKVTIKKSSKKSHFKLNSGRFKDELENNFSLVIKASYKRIALINIASVTFLRGGKTVS